MNFQKFIFGSGKKSWRFFGGIAIGLALSFILVVGGLLLFQQSRGARRLLVADNVQPVVCSAEMSDAEVATIRHLSVGVVRRLRQLRSLSNREICEIPQGKLESAIQKLEHPKPDHPDEAALYRLHQLQDENGYIPPDAYTQAAEHIRKMREHQQSLSAEGAGIENDSWTWLGPGNIGGRVRSIIIHPTNPNTMWAGSVGGGIWRTDDGGGSWTPVDDFMANLAIGCMVMDPTDSNVMYAGTGEGFYNVDAIRGEGIFKSIDGGVTWNQLSSTNNSNFYWVNRLTISPDGSTILAATRDSGIFRSTDGGANWTQTLSSTWVGDVDFDPSNGNNAVAGGLWGSGAWYSTNGGQSWTASTFNSPGIADAGRIEVAYAPSSPNIVYASIDLNSGELWKSTDGGHTYSLVNTGTEYLGGQGWYDNIVWVDPTNPDVVVVGGIDLWRSTDAGASFTKISEWWSSGSGPR